MRLLPHRCSTNAPGCERMSTEIRAARRALQKLHRQHLGYAMQVGDMDYVRTMNAMFALLIRLEEEA